MDLKALKQNVFPESLSGSLLLKNLPIILFVTLMLVLYIANSHSAEKKIRQIQNAQNEVKSLRWEYMSLHSDHMQKTRRSELVKVAPNYQLDAPKQQVKKIVVAKN